MEVKKEVEEEVEEVEVVRGARCSCRLLGVHMTKRMCWMKPFKC